MASIETLEKRLLKERDLEKKHKQNADRLQKEIENQKLQEIKRSVNKMNMSADEYKKFMTALRDKQDLMDAIDLIESGKAERRKDDTDASAENK